jgi:hypothetical protein
MRITNEVVVVVTNANYRISQLMRHGRRKQIIPMAMEKEN